MPGFADTWIPLYSSLVRHPKTIRAAKALRVSRPAMIGHLVCLWAWACDYAPTGELTGVESIQIAEGAEWPGDPDVFLEALIDARGPSGHGFIDVDDDGTRLHDWEDYLGTLLERREANRVAQQAHRDRLKASKPVRSSLIRESDDVTLTSALRHDDVTVRKSDVTPLPDQTGPDMTKPNPIAPAAEAAEKKDAVKATRGDQSAALWDALIASGFPTPVTKSERDRRNAGIKQLVDAEIAPDEIAIFRAAYIIMFPQAPVTLHGLLNHIAELRVPASVRPPAAPTAPTAPASQYDGPRFNGGYTEDESLKAERQAIDRRGDLAALTGMLAGKVVNIADEKTARASLEEIRAKIGGGGNGKAPRPTYRIKDVGPTADRASPEHRPGDHEAPERTGQSS